MLEPLIDACIVAIISVLLIRLVIACIAALVSAIGDFRQ